MKIMGKLIFFAVLTLGFLTLTACSGTPKPEYPRSYIDRPYTIPDGMAKWSILANADYEVYKGPDESLVDDDKVEDSHIFAYPLYFESGLSDDLTIVWIPLPTGLRWQILRDEKHTLGFSFNYLFFAFTGELTYWYQINEKLSVRPYFSGYAFDLYFVEEETSQYGVKGVYQFHPHWAFELDAFLGATSVDSDFIDDITKELTGLEVDSQTDGTFAGAGFLFASSVTETWDILFGVTYSRFKLDSDFEYDVTRFNLITNYYW